MNNIELTNEDYELIFENASPMLRFEKLMEERSVDESSKMHLLNSIIRTNIVCDTGDGRSEFLMNTLSPSWGGRVYGYNYHIHDDAGIAWLTHQQGYKKQELNSYIHVIDNKWRRETLPQGFLFSAAYEIWHEMSEVNPLTFLVKMKLKDLLLLNELIKWGRRTKKWNGYLNIDKRTRTGFWDYSCGSGSLMGITLEKDVKLPTKYIHFAQPDCMQYYTVEDVYGTTTMWNKGGVTLLHLPKKFRKDLPSLGFDESLIDAQISNYQTDYPKKNIFIDDV